MDKYYFLQFQLLCVRACFPNIDRWFVMLQNVLRPVFRVTVCSMRGVDTWTQLPTSVKKINVPNTDRVRTELHVLLTESATLAVYALRVTLGSSVIQVCADGLMFWSSFLSERNSSYDLGTGNLWGTFMCCWCQMPNYDVHGDRKLNLFTWPKVRWITSISNI